MRHERIGPAREGEAGIVHASERPAVSTKVAKTQPRTIPAMPAPESGISVATWREALVRDGYFTTVEIVDGDLGPIGVLGSPLVCLGTTADCTVVWICPSRLPWGWPDPFRAYLKANSTSARRYAVSLALKLRDAATAEQTRRQRIHEAKVKERLSFLNLRREGDAA